MRLIVTELRDDMLLQVDHHHHHHHGHRYCHHRGHHQHHWHHYCHHHQLQLQPRQMSLIVTELLQVVNHHGVHFPQGGGYTASASEEEEETDRRKQFEKMPMRVTRLMMVNMMTARMMRLMMTMTRLTMKMVRWAVNESDCRCQTQELAQRPIYLPGFTTPG